MKTVVSLQDLVDSEIRPQPLVDEYHRLLQRDLRARWRPDTLRDVPCPGCGNSESTPAFAKFDAHYRECTRCRSLFVSPRPDEAALVAFYREAESAGFWRTHVWPMTAASRLDKLARPRAEWVLEGLAEYAPAASRGVDLSPYGRPVAEELARAGKEMRSAGWVADLDSGEDAVVPASPAVSGQLPALGPCDFVTAFDVFDRAAEPRALTSALERTIAPGGLLFLTATNADGFDVRVLWDRAAVFAPPDKLNVLSIDGLLTLLAAPAWEVLEVSTPGMFDVEHVRRAMEADPAAPWPPFVRALMRRGPRALEDFQEYLQRHRLASFARIVARRR